MDWGSPWIWLPVLAIGIGLVVWIRIYSSRSRKRDFLANAAALGFRPALKGKPLSPTERRLIPLFRSGNSAKFRYVMKHPSGALLFDYQYRFGLPLIASVIYYQTVAALPVPHDGIPDFCLSPATSVDRVGMKLGISNVAVESVPEFSSRYYLRGRDSAAIASLFTDIGPEWMRIDAGGNLFVEKGGHWLVVYERARVVLPQFFEAFLQEGSAIADLIMRRRATKTATVMR